MTNSWSAIDNNDKPTLTAVTDDSNQYIQRVLVDPATGRLLVSATGLGVTSINTLTGAVILAAGTNITLGTVGNTITINSTGGSSGITVNSTTITGGTTGQLLYDNTGTVGELALATYPSLTELSYVKGVTSSIQTQLNAKGAGTVTSVAALTLGTTGTDLSSTVANPTTTPVITLQVPTASATNRGALSSTDWSTFNGKQSTISFGTGVQTSLGVNIGSAGAPVLFNGALGTPLSGSAANLTSFPTLNQNTSGTAANLSGTPALPNGTTATTQSANDNSTKLATTAYADLQANNVLEFLSRQTIINGGFTVNQRVYVSGATLAAGVYGHDRWKAGSGGGDYTFTQLPQSTVITIGSGKSLIQVVEDKNVIGGTYTLSWTGTATARYAINSATPAGSYAASPIVITGQTAGTTISVEFTNGTLSNVQLSLGSVALPFQPKSYAEELRDCQRYYWRMNADVPFGHFATGYNVTTTTALFVVPYEVQMRTSPTFSSSAPATFNIGPAGIAGTVVTIDTTSKSASSIIFTVASGLTVNGGSRVFSDGVGSAYLGFSAEL